MSVDGERGVASASAPRWRPLGAARGRPIGEWVDPTPASYSYGFGDDSGRTRTPDSYSISPFPTAAPTALYRADVSLTLDGLRCSQFDASAQATLASAVASLVSGVESGDVGDMACVGAARRRLAADDDDDEAAFAARHGAAGRRRLGADDSADISMMVAVSEDAGVSGARPTARASRARSRRRSRRLRSRRR